MRLLARSCWLLTTTLALGTFPACKKTAEDAKGAGAPARAGAPTGAAPGAPKAPAAPAFDVAAAEKVLIAHPYQGVFNGKPLRLNVVMNRGTKVAILRLGDKMMGSPLKLDPSGRFSVRTRPRPTPMGLETDTFSATIASDFSSIKGSAKRAAKQGFVEQSSGIGEFTLSRGEALKGWPVISPQPPGSATAALGLRPGDEIMELAGKPVAPGDALELPDTVGAEVKAVVWREGKRVELKGKIPPPPKAPPAPAPAPAK